MEAPLFELKHSIQPYVIVGGVLVLLTLASFVLAIAGAGWGGVLAGIVITAVYLAKISLFDLRYSVCFKDDRIIMHVATWSNTPAALTTIRVADITSIKRETSDLRTIAAQQRVTQRIAIYDDAHKKFVDVSLKHFTDASIRQLMQAIHKLRPDLQMPEGWA